MTMLKPKIEISPAVSLPERGYVIACACREERYLIASCEELGVFTQAETLGELKKNLKGAVELSLADGEHKEYGLPPSPVIWLVYEELF